MTKTYIYDTDTFSLRLYPMQSNHLSIKNETMSITVFTAVCYIICSSFHSHCTVFNNEHKYVILLPDHFRIVCGQCIFRYTDA